MISSGETKMLDVLLHHVKRQKNQLVRSTCCHFGRWSTGASLWKNGFMKFSVSHARKSGWCRCQWSGRDHTEGWLQCSFADVEVHCCTLLSGSRLCQALAPQAARLVTTSMSAHPAQPTHPAHAAHAAHSQLRAEKEQLSRDR